MQYFGRHQRFIENSNSSISKFQRGSICFVQLVRWLKSILPPRSRQSVYHDFGIAKETNRLATASHWLEATMSPVPFARRR